MTIIRGLFDSAQYEAGIKKLDVRDMIFQLQPDMAPFLSILGKLSKAKAVDTQISWFEDDLLGNYTMLDMGGNAAADELHLVVDSTDFMQIGDVLKVVDTGECLFVEVVTSATEITVKRNWGTTAAAIIHNNDYLYKLGNAQQEGYTAPDSLVTAKVPKSNYLQIFSKTVEITETADKVATYGGNRRNFERNKKAVEMKREIESQLLFGEPKQDTGGAHPCRQTGGVKYFLDLGAPVKLNQNGAALTETAWEGFLKDLFTYGSIKKYFFTGNLILSQISQFASGKQRLEPGKDVKYGIKVTTYHSACGDVELVHDGHFIGPYAGYGFALDMPEFIYRYLDGMDFKLALSIQPPNVHYIMDEYTCTIGFEIHHSPMHGYVYGVA